MNYHPEPSTSRATNPMYSNAISKIKPIPNKTPKQIAEQENEELNRLHPNTFITYFYCMIALLGIAFGMVIAIYSCGSRYLWVSLLHLIMFLFCLSPLFRAKISPRKRRIVFYVVMSVYIAIVGIISLAFISVVKQQAYCDSQWCHHQTDTREFITSLKQKYSESQLDSKCNFIQSTYDGQMENEQVGMFLVTEMTLFCANASIECDGVSNTVGLDQHVNWLNLDFALGMLALLGVLEILFALGLIVWLIKCHPRTDSSTYADLQCDSIVGQVYDNQGSMIRNQDFEYKDAMSKRSIIINNRDNGVSMNNPAIVKRLQQENSTLAKNNYHSDIQQIINLSSVRMEESENPQMIKQSQNKAPQGQQQSFVSATGSADGQNSLNASRTSSKPHPLTNYQNFESGSNTDKRKPADQRTLIAAGSNIISNNPSKPIGSPGVGLMASARDTQSVGQSSHRFNTPMKPTGINREGLNSARGNAPAMSATSSYDPQKIFM